MKKIFFVLLIVAAFLAACAAPASKGTKVPVEIWFHQAQARGLNPGDIDQVGEGPIWVDSQTWCEGETTSAGVAVTCKRSHVLWITGGTQEGEGFLEVDLPSTWAGEFTIP